MIKAHKSLSNENANQASIILSEVSDLINPAPEQQIQETTPNTSFSPPCITSPDLILYYEILVIILNCKLGLFDTSLALIKKVHAKLEASSYFQPGSTDLLQGYCVLKFGDGDEELEVKILSKSKLLCLVYFYSGLIYKHGV